jgi:hypothetical protein
MEVKSSLNKCMQLEFFTAEPTTALAFHRKVISRNAMFSDWKITCEGGMLEAFHTSAAVVYRERMELRTILGERASGMGILWSAKRSGSTFLALSVSPPFYA